MKWIDKTDDLINTFGKDIIIYNQEQTEYCIIGDGFINILVRNDMTAQYFVQVNVIDISKSTPFIVPKDSEYKIILVGKASISKIYVLN